MIIRRAIPADISMLNAVVSEADALHVRGVPEIFRMPRPAGRSRAYWMKLISDRKRALFVAQDKGKVLGYVDVAIKSAEPFPLLRPRRFGYVSSLVVTRRLRRKRVGYKLMDAVHAWLSKSGVQSVSLNVWSFNSGAVKFYKRLRYRFVNHRMVRRLGSERGIKAGAK